MSYNLFRLFSRFLHPRNTKRRPIVTRTVRTRKPTRRLDLLNLEGRVVPAPLVSEVLAGTSATRIVGTVYNDLDSNGIKSGGENGISSWTVYLDLDRSGTLNTDAAGVLEPSAVTNKDGDYTFSKLMPGVYRVNEIVQPGWTPTAPASQDVAVANGTSVTANFFNFSGGDIVGHVWNDLNQDGVRDIDPTAGTYVDPGLEGWTVFLDANNNRLLDAGEASAITDATGAYSFTNLPANDYEVTITLPDGWDIAPTFDNRQTASVAARQQVTQDFAFFSLVNGSLEGTVWNDQNGDGVREADPVTGDFTEPGLAGVTVFLDLDHNGIADAGEPTTITDANGKYSFISLAEGDYEVTQLLPDGFDVAPTFDIRQTAAVRAGRATTGIDFADFTVLNGSIRGTVWNDKNHDGIRNVSLAGAFTEPGIPNWSVFLDRNKNLVADPGEPTALTDANGEYVFSDLQVGDYEVRELLTTGWEVAPTFSDSVGVTVYSGSQSIAPDFAVYNLSASTPGSLSGTVWNDANANGRRDTDPATGAFTDLGMAGWTLFLDANSNGVRDVGEATAETGLDGSYSFTGVLPGTVTIVEELKTGWRGTAPITATRTIALRNGENATGLDFGDWALQDSSIRGTVFADTNKNGIRDPGERGLDVITVYLDVNNNGVLDAGEPTNMTAADQFYTPSVDETGTYSFTHLAIGNYTVRSVLPAVLSATPTAELAHTVTLTAAQDRSGIDTAAVFRPTEIHGTKFDDVNGDHKRDVGEAGIGGVTVFVDLDRNDRLDAGEPTAVTATDGSYTFTGLAPGAYVVREVLSAGRESTYPTTTSGILWPTGTSNPAVGTVSPTAITTSLGIGQTFKQTVSITLPGTGALTNLVDVFLLFDDTGSFTNNSPIVRAAFPDIISQLQTALPGIDLGFGVGRFEEYANFAYEYSTGRPFVLNQPIVAASTTGYMTAIQAALNRTTPGYGGDQPETDIEALYQLVTGRGFDGNNNGSVLDSGAAGLASTQLNPGASGDVPSFASFQADPGANVLAAAGNVGGGGFRSGALPIVLVATDTGFAFQPKGETSITGVGGASLPVSAFSQTSRPTTPNNNGAGIQETITGLNALGALVIGLGTNPDATVDPRQGLEAISQLTGAVNRSTTTIDNGTANPIAPGDPLYFQISSGFSSSVAAGVVNAIQNAVTNVAVDVTIQASDPRVRITNFTGTRTGVGAGQTASFDIEFVGDGVPRRFDLQFVRAGTNVVLGSIPVVIGTPIAGSGYEFEELDDGEIETSADFGSRAVTTSVTAPTISLTASNFTYDGATHAAIATASGTEGTAVAGSFAVTYNGSALAPAAVGVYTIVATFTSADPQYSNASATSTLTITAATPTVSVQGGTFAFDGNMHAATARAVGLGGASVAGTFQFTYNGSATPPATAGSYEVVAFFTSSDTSYANAVGTATITIGSVAPTIAVQGGSFQFDGTSHVASATATGVDGASIAGSFSFTYNGSTALPVAAGLYDVVATFTSADANYSGAVGSALLRIGTLTPTVSVVGGPFNYDGVAHTASANVQGLAGATVAGNLSFTYNGLTALPVAAGLYDVVATFTSADANYTGAVGSAKVIVTAATPTVTLNDGSFIFDGKPHSSSASATGVSGSPIAGAFTIRYAGSLTPPTNAGAYEVSASFVSSDANYTDGAMLGTLTIGKASPLFSGLSTPVITVGTASVSVTGRLTAGLVVPGGEAVSATLNGVTQSAVVDTAGNFNLTFDASTLPQGTNAISILYVGGSNFNTAVGSTTVLVNAVVSGAIDATGLNVQATAGAPITATVATIANTLGSGAYSAIIAWGDGSQSAGVIAGSGAILSVVGTHTYADPGTAVVRVTILDNLGLGLTASTLSAANIVTLGKTAGKSNEAEFWHKTAGQNLILAFNGGAAHTELSAWLATSFPNLYGATAGSANLTGKTNADVATYFQGLWKANSDGAAVEVLTTALNVYATTFSLGGAQATAFGFKVTSYGLGAMSFNVGKDGIAFGVPAKTKLNVFEMLRSVDQQAVNGVLFGGNRLLQNLAGDAFEGLNSI